MLAEQYRVPALAATTLAGGVPAWQVGQTVRVLSYACWHGMQWLQHGTAPSAHCAATWFGGCQVVRQTGCVGTAVCLKEGHAWQQSGDWSTSTL
jgi:hypothetical protein